jgi:hypothetical protein
MLEEALHARLALPRSLATQRLHLMLGASLSSGTQQVYASRVRKYCKACAQQGLPAFPATEASILSFVAFMSLEGAVNAKSFPQYVAAVLTVNRDLQLPAPHIPLLKAAYKGAHRLQSAQQQEAARGALPASVVAQALELSLQPAAAPSLVLASAGVALAFHAFLRGHSLSSLCLDDLTISNSGYTCVVWDEKTRSHAGQRRQLPGDCTACPALLRLLAVALQLRRQQGASPTDRLFPGGGLDQMLQLVLRTLDLTPPAGVTWSGHSCRKGGASAAAAIGVPLHKLRHRGGWLSDVVFVYIDPDFIASPESFDFFSFLLPVAARPPGARP